MTPAENFDRVPAELRKEDQRTEIRRALRLLHAPGEVFEIRILKARVNGRAVTVAGYFDDIDAAVEAALQWDAKAEGVYQTMNAIHSGLLARSPNRLASLENTTTDRDVIRRKAILLDFDPERPRGISSSTEELELAREVARSCYHWLKEQGLDSAVACSGNGWHVVLLVDLPNDAESTRLVKRFLEVMALRFNTDRVKIDTAVHNPARIVKLLGTLAAKGISTEERPHRCAKLVKEPESIEVVPHELLEKIVAQSPPDSPTQPPASSSPELQTVLAALEQRGITVREPAHYKDGLKYILSACLFNPDHGGTSVALIEYANGAKQYSCLHTECKGKKWGDVLRELQPETPPASKPSASGQSKINIAQLPDVCAMASEKVEFIVPGLLVKDNLTLFTGQPSAGKSTLALWLADAIAQGREVLGGRCQQAEVLYLTREMPVNYVADVARRLSISNGPGTNLYIWGDWIPEQAPVPAASHVLAWVSQRPRPPFIVIDSLMAFFPGNNENDSTQMRLFVNQGRTLLRAGACGVLILHHPGKAESAKTYRGSSDLEPAIDAGYSVRNSGDGVLDRLHLKLWRPRFIDQKRELVLHYRDGGFVEDERRVAVAVVETITQQLRKLLEQMPGCTVTEFQNAAMARGLTQVRARDFLKSGVEFGSILREEGSHNRFFHRLAPDKGKDLVQ